MTTRLTKMGLSRFKNIDLGEEGFCPGELSVLIGHNGYGHSNLVSVLWFLQESLVERE